MASQTPNLNLYKVNPETDGEMTFNVKTMLNENWDRLDESIGEVHQEITTHRADYVRHPGYAVTAGTGNAYTITTDPAPTAYVDGMGIVIRANRANTGAATLNWNGLGAMPIVDAKGNALIAGKIPNGARLSLRYSSAAGNFQLQGEGGEYGTATPAEVMQGYTIGTEEGVLPGTLALTGNAAAGDVIAGQTFYNTNPKSKVTGTLALTGDAAAAQVLSGRTFYTTNPKSRLTGTMANRGAVTNTITTQGGQYTIPQGYHSGSGVVTASFANLIPGNVRQGVNIGGVVGNFFRGKKFASGTVTSGVGRISFIRYDDTRENVEYVDIVSEFGFLPTFIVLYRLNTATGTSTTTIVYPVDLNASFPGTKIECFNANMRYKLDGIDAIVSESRIRLPVREASTLYQWLAYE